MEPTLDTVRLLERVTQLESELNNMHDSRNALEKELNQLKLDRDRAMAESVQSRDAAVMRMQRQMRELLEEVDSLRGERAANSSAASGGAAQEEVMTLRAENAMLQAQVAHYEASFKHLLGDLATLRTKFAALRGGQAAV